MANIKDKALDIEGLIDSAVSERNERYNPDNISAAEKQDLQTAVLASWGHSLCNQNYVLLVNMHRST